MVIKSKQENARYKLQIKVNRQTTLEEWVNVQDITSLTRNLFAIDHSLSI